MWAVAPDIAIADYYGNDGVPKWQAGDAPNPVVNRYKTKDGRWFQLMFLQADRYWADFCVRIGRPELSDDARFTPLANLTANKVEATALLREVFAERDLAEWVEIFQAETGAWCTLASPAEVPNDPQVQANGYLLTLTDDKGEEFHTVAAPSSSTKPRPSRPAPRPRRTHRRDPHRTRLRLGQDHRRQGLWSRPVRASSRRTFETRSALQARRQLLRDQDAWPQPNFLIPEAVATKQQRANCRHLPGRDQTS